MAGLLILVQLTAAIISHSVILEPLLYDSNDFLVAFSENSTPAKIAVLLDFIVGASWFAASVLLFPILKQFNERVALWFTGIRLAEFVTLIMGGIIVLAILFTSQKYVGGNTSDGSNLMSMGELLRYSRGSTQNLSLLAYSMGSLLLYYLLFRTKLIPRFISILGFVGVAGLLVDTLLSIFGYYTGELMYFIMLPMGLSEILLGLWLIVKGFNLNPKPPITPSLQTD